VTTDFVTSEPFSALLFWFRLFALYMSEFLQRLNFGSQAMASGAKRFMVFNFRGYARVSDSSLGDSNDAPAPGKSVARNQTHAAATTAAPDDRPASSRGVETPDAASHGNPNASSAAHRVPLFAYPLLVAAVRSGALPAAKTL
jgi:hypothetical protein